MLGNSFGSVLREVGCHTFRYTIHTHTHTLATLQRAVLYMGGYVNVLMWLAGGRKYKQKRGQRERLEPQWDPQWSRSHLISVPTRCLKVEGKRSGVTVQRETRYNQAIDAKCCRSNWIHFKQLKERRRKNSTDCTWGPEATWCRSLMFGGNCSLNTLRSASGWYYWPRQTRGLEGFWQVDKCCLTRQSTGRVVRCSLTALTLSPSATQKGVEPFKHTQPWIRPLVPGHQVSEPAVFFPPKPWKRDTSGLLRVKPGEMPLDKILTTHSERSTDASVFGDGVKWWHIHFHHWGWRDLVV